MVSVMGEARKKGVIQPLTHMMSTRKVTVALVAALTTDPSCAIMLFQLEAEKTQSS